jgi:hypothetical protein
MPAPSFDTSALLDEARRIAGGPTEFGTEPNDHLQAMEELVRSTANEAKLRNPEPFRRSLVHQLANRLRIEDSFAKRPEILRSAVPRPLVITGLPRAGTTLFSRLLAEDPAGRAFQLWELLSPAPSSLDAPAALTQDRLTVAETEVLERAAAGSLRIRPISMFMPEECHYLFRNAFYSTQLGMAVAHRPSYMKWVSARDWLPAYAYYKKQVQLLLWQRPCADGGYVILKCPRQHWAYVDKLFAVLPDAHVLDFRRDIMSVMKSFCHLTRTVRKAHSDHVDPLDVGRDVLRQLETGMHMNLAAVKKLDDQQRSRIITLQYEEWSSDPMSAVKSVYRAIGRELRPEVEERMRVYLRENPRHGEQSKYDLAEFGLTEATIRDAFAPLTA